MILERSKPSETGGSARRYAAYRRVRRSVADLETELTQIEQTIKDFTNRTKTLADELGARYAVFRCSGRRFDDVRDIRRADLMALSREADEYIEAIYFLEQRRKELLNQIQIHQTANA